MTCERYPTSGSKLADFAAKGLSTGQNVDECTELTQSFFSFECCTGLQSSRGTRTQDSPCAGAHNDFQAQVQHEVIMASQRCYPDFSMVNLQGGQLQYQQLKGLLAIQTSTPNSLFVTTSQIGSFQKIFLNLPISVDWHSARCALLLGCLCLAMISLLRSNRLPGQDTVILCEGREIW